MNLKARFISFLVTCCVAPQVVLANNISDHLFRQVDHPDVQTTLAEFPNLLADGTFDVVIDKSHDLQKWLDNAELSIRVKAHSLNNLSIYLAQAGEPNLALAANNKSTDLLESISPFDQDLYHVLMAKGYILAWEDANPQAEDALRHAQHIAHRNQGVYAKDQIPALRLLTDVQLNKGRAKAADQTQRFFLKVNEQIYGVGSEDLIPSLAEVGEYFANRGRTIPSGQARTPSVFMVGRNRTVELQTPETDVAYRARIFREAERAFMRSIAIIEDKYGPTDLRLVEPLKGLSKSKFLEGYSRGYAEKPMEHMAAIVQQNPGADASDKAKALVDLADLYIKTDDPRATETYKQAWQLLVSEEHEELRYELFGRPVRLLPEHNFRPSLLRYPVSIEPNQSLFVALNYNVTGNGRVRQVEVSDSNIPLRDQKQTRQAVQMMRFRPRMVEGEPVVTEGLSLHQTFTVKKPNPEFKVEVTSGTGIR